MAAVLSAVAAREDLAAGRIVEVPVAGADLHRRLHAVWAEDRRLSNAEGALLRIAVCSGRRTPATAAGPSDR